MGDPIQNLKSSGPLGVGTTRKTDGRWNVTSKIRNVKADHYEPGEKESSSHGVLSLTMRRVRPFDAWVYGFPPGKATINMPDLMARLVFKRLLDEALKYIEQVPGRKQLRNIKLFGCTDRVGGSKSYNDTKLRQDRANAFKALFEKLLPSSGQQPQITALPLVKSQLPYFIKDRGTARIQRNIRQHNRGVGVIFIKPPVPKGCYEPGKGPTKREALDKIKEALEHIRAKQILRGKDHRFMLSVVKMLLSGGNDEYITEPQVRGAIGKWARELNKQFKTLKKLSSEDRDALGKKYGMKSIPGYDVPLLPKKTVEREAWYYELAHKILYAEKRHLYTITSTSLIAELKKVVREKCRDIGLIQAVLPVYVRQIIGGRKAVDQGANWAKAMLAGMGGSRAAETFIERGVQKWMKENEKSGNSIYSIYTKVYGK